jgi:hypothetical protein
MQGTCSLSAATGVRVATSAAARAAKDHRQESGDHRNQARRGRRRPRAALEQPRLEPDTLGGLAPSGRPVVRFYVSTKNHRH